MTVQEGAQDQDIGHDHEEDQSGEPYVNEIEVRGLIVGAFQENCWVIGNRRTREAICIDPGEQADDILHMASEMGVTIKMIANSHAHLDHVLGVRGVQSADNAAFLLHEADLDILQGAAASAANFGMQVEQPPDPDHYIDDEQRVEVDGVQLHVIHTPGHTRGSVCFYGHGVLFSGDTLFRNSIGRTDLPGGDYAQEMSSIVDKLLMLPDDTIVLPGHMDQTTLGAERTQNPFVLQTLQQRGLQPGERQTPGGLILPN
ncbi:MAG: MBL fold metallo-hydrolase [Chloroflexi bacterium]|nr:MBL fold metallo-hydrolase [Chloroflexota bacterium]MYF80372.1 MBL fold metallo-hydrolase [Chloroflexota bacterium]MYI05515.1 MBL fold metallo-hydrolase [Chloroflexota bacterium]